MATTTPDALWSPDLGTGYNPVTDLAHMQDTVQTALNNKPVNYRTGLDSARVTPVGWTPTEGVEYYSTDTNAKWFYDGSAWDIATPGQVLISRTSFTSASSVPFTGFNANFEDYLAILEINSSSTPSGGTLRMRSAGVDNTAAQYAGQQQVANGTAVTAQRVSAQTSFPMLPLTAIEHTIRIEFSRPAVAAVTRMSVEASSWSDPSTGWTSSLGGRHNVTSSFDGFSYIPSAGTITGTLAVYGRA